MANSSLMSDSSKVVESAELEETSNNIPDPISNHFDGIVVSIAYILTFLICIAGMVGNGIVIRLLGFGMKRNPFTTYVLNLAVADIGVLILSILGIIVIIIFLWSGAKNPLGFYIFAYAFSIMYITDQLLLTVISVDRCVAILFPLWHRCHRPKHLSGIICVSMWVLSLLITGFDVLLSFVNEITLLQFLVNVAICTPVMVISTIILFVKSCNKFQQHKRGKLLLAISLALFFFLTFGLPMNYFYVAIYYKSWNGIDEVSLFSRTLGNPELNATVLLEISSQIHHIIILAMVSVVCIVLNCSINPLIYFLVGRKKGQPRQSMKVALQRIFKEEGNCRGQEEPQPETQL